jgi:nitroimidazol reductase NimA-like FMN-containing flavoprotein (pyridoxamine 5'-phosphate oxidase superfamily)
MLDQMKALARSKTVCVLATIAGSKPYCSLMAYATDEECREVYMATRRDTNKFRNLTENTSVSLLIDTRETLPRSQAQALTVEGVCAPIVDPARKDRARARLLEKNPHLEEFLAHPECVLLRVEIKAFLLLKGLTEAHHATL